MPARKAAAEPSKVDGKGRTIIPLEIRKALGLDDESGGYVVYERDGDGARLHRVEWSKPKRHG